MLSYVPVSNANDFLGASYHSFLHTETNKTVIRMLSYRSHGSSSIYTDHHADDILWLGLSTDTAADIAGAPQWCRSGASKGGVRHLHHPVVRDCVVPALALQHSNLHPHENILGTMGFRGRTASQADLVGFSQMADPEVRAVKNLMVMNGL
jgi:hypothetical protein